MRGATGCIGEYGPAFVVEKRASLAQIVERHLDCDFNADDDADFVADHLPRQRRAHDVALITAVTVPFIVTLGTLTIESPLRLTALALAHELDGMVKQ